jgi:hypothetical protein
MNDAKSARYEARTGPSLRAEFVFPALGKAVARQAAPRREPRFLSPAQLLMLLRERHARQNRVPWAKTKGILGG